MTKRTRAPQGAHQPTVDNLTTPPGVKKKKEITEVLKVKKTPEEKAAKKAEKKLKERETRQIQTPPKTHVANKVKKESTIKFNTPAEGKVEFRKIGRGSLRKIPGCQPIIKPGETFLCVPENIPVGFRNSVVRTDNEKAKFESDIQSVDMVYKIKKLTSGLFNVVNKKAKKMNSKPLSREDAVTLRNDLND